MKSTSLKTLLGLSIIISAGSAFMSAQQVEAIIPQGTFSEAEKDLLVVKCAEILNYTNHIIRITDDIFDPSSTKATVQYEIDEMKKYREEIKKIASEIPTIGSSSLAQESFKALKQFAHKLHDAQHLWVITFEKRDISELKKIEPKMTGIFNVLQQKLLGELKGSKRINDTLIKQMQAGQAEGALALLQKISDNVDVIFNYPAKNKHKHSKISMGWHLYNKKGFKNLISL